ncbi:putative NADPH:adrenodoxin oxidoreductase, mitochondrial [Glarea lozoyensis 74030]|uniref:adrenodoxin-NADP(+) reductase n=1 Tax=Glarea lozoyensis (strain ATCC 74030 / MF5533) TaxID=1104152 RepID=H0EEM8_GLAL7|nr:putative NADPH:adrenodoxin oxidoreductase, mitochondrial [Glarea lozoyensis 74030]
MAVIGSGPAGFYTSYKVMSKIEDAVVDMYEHLPVPFGLVRFGVAPDHPDVKNCQDKFQEVAESPRFNFVGNIAIGNSDSELPLQSLLPHYDAILFAYGASKDRTLNIPGEGTLKGIYSARAFVGWYNGLPEYAGLAPDLSLGEEAVVIGQGNVALDVARILLEDVNVLRKTDITDEAIQTLEKSKVKRVNVVGRRGPLQAAFSIKEVRELVRLPNVAFHPVDATLIPKDLKSLDRPPRRIMEVLLKGYKSEALPGFDTLNIPFDNTKGVIPNDFLGRVVDNQKDWLQSATATPMPGMYCAGWVKRGPTGVIASTMDDAFSTASSIVMDWKENKPFLNPDGNTGLGWEGVKAGAAERNLRRISWEDWKRIDAAEKENGRKVGKEREKFTSISKMLAVLD